MEREPNPGPYGSLFRELLEEDDRFAVLLDNPPVLTRMKAILGNAVQLHSASGRVTPPGTPEQNWHRDGPWPQDPDGTPFGSIPGQINCGYYQNAWMKSRETFDGPKMTALRENGTPEQKLLLGGIPRW